MPYKNKEKIKEYDRWRYHNNPKRKEQCLSSDKRRRKTQAYKIYHKDYDQSTPTYKKNYGEYWECAKIIKFIQAEIIKLFPDSEERRNLLGRNKIRARQIAWERHIKFGHNFNY